MRVDSAFRLPVRDPRCCPGKLGEPSWVLTKGYPKIRLSESSPAGAACPCREGSLLLLCISSPSRGDLSRPQTRGPYFSAGLLSHPVGECCMGRSTQGSCCPKTLIFLLLCCWPTASTFFHPIPVLLAHCLDLSAAGAVVL